MIGATYRLGDVWVFAAVADPPWMKYHGARFTPGRFWEVVSPAGMHIGHIVAAADDWFTYHVHWVSGIGSTGGHGESGFDTLDEALAAAVERWNANVMGAL